MNLKRYAIRSKHNGQLLKLDIENEAKTVSYMERQIGFEPFIENETTIKTYYFLKSIKTNLPVWMTKRKEIAEKVLKTFDLEKDNSFEIPFIKFNECEWRNSFEVVEINLTIC